MSEMLGNYYFHIRNFASALSYLEKANKNNPNKFICKKMIICYLTLNNVEQALNLFLNVIEEDLDFIINTHLEEEDCPCPNLIYEIENENRKTFLSDYELFITLGILYAYCDIDKSIDYLKLGKEQNQQNIKLEKIINILFQKSNSKKSFINKNILGDNI